MKKSMLKNGIAIVIGLLSLFFSQEAWAQKEGGLTPAPSSATGTDAQVEPDMITKSTETSADQVSIVVLSGKCEYKFYSRKTKNDAWKMEESGTVTANETGVPASKKLCAKGSHRVKYEVTVESENDIAVKQMSACKG